MFADNFRSRIKPVPGYDPDFAVQLVLLSADAVVPGEFQDSEEHADDRRLVHAGLKQVGEGDATLASQLAVNPLHVNLDRRFVIDNRGRRNGLRIAQDAAHRADQVP